MPDRLPVLKTHKLFIGGAFPRSESGRSLVVHDAKERVVAHVARGSRKDLRDAVKAARAAQSGWAARTAYNRSQILYRLAEVLEARATEFHDALRSTGAMRAPAARKEVETSIDRLVILAGWCDKYQQVVGCQNPVAGPYHDFSVPEPIGVVGVIAPDESPLLGLVASVGLALVAANTVVALGSGDNPIPTSLFGEVCATSDVPGGVVNLLMGDRSELRSWFGSHRDIDALLSSDLDDDDARDLAIAASDRCARVVAIDENDLLDAERGTTPRLITRLCEIKTLWHPIGS